MHEPEGPQPGVPDDLQPAAAAEARLAQADVETPTAEPSVPPAGDLTASEGPGDTSGGTAPGPGPVDLTKAPAPAAGAGADWREPIAVLGLGARTWKCAVFELLNLPLGIAGFVCMITLVSLGSGMAVTVVGLPILASGLIVCRAWGRVDRARARALLGLKIESPSRVAVPGRGLFGWALARLADPVGWRAALYLLIRLPWGIITFTVTLVLLLVLWPVAPYVIYAFAAADRAMISALLSPSSAAEKRIRDLEAGRETMVDAAAADRRRIERDLHDGAQARLVALAMDLGLARERMAEDPQAATRAVEQAHGEVKVVLEELRNLARGIHPAILTERGLGAAIANVAGRCAVPVSVTVDLPARPAAAVEGLLYFTTAELLTNISKHSGAGSAVVRLIRSGRTIQLTVTDDGRGGAAVTPRGGLAGLAERVRAMDGVFTVASPPGGPTVATVRLPWQDPGDPAIDPAAPARAQARDAKQTLKDADRAYRQAQRDLRHAERHLNRHRPRY